MDWLLYVGLGVAAVFASLVGAIAGLGAAIIMLPLVTLAFGVQEAIPIVTVSMVLANAARAWVYRARIHWPVAKWFLIGAIPMALVGSLLFVNAPASLLTRLLGAFLLLEVAVRRLNIGKGRMKMTLRGFLPVGMLQGFVSALVGAAGPVGAPFYLAYGLMRGAFVGTAAIGTIGMHFTKIVIYRNSALLDGQALAVGLGIGVMMWIGAYMSKLVVDRISDKVFVHIIEAVMAIAGILFLVRG
ncbi:MAG: sulfite exporter TauE/SafE family protein [SAR202 cluster bacterium]|nr:sulfite exporter TauE/SafE family protein [SAR202 cluster bacterium]